MKKELIGILICMMMLATIPIVAGIQLDTNPTTTETTGPFDKTFIRGIILFPRLASGGKEINFLAVRVHYRTISLVETKEGVLKLQRVTIPNELNGILGKFYIFGTFQGELGI